MSRSAKFDFRKDPYTLKVWYCFSPANKSSLF